MLRPGPSVTRLVALAAGAMLLGAPAGAATSPHKPAAVAVYPVENLSGEAIPADEIRRSLGAPLASEGVHVFDNAALDQFFERHRVRYTGGIDGVTADALRAETGVQAILIASVEQTGTGLPPRLALFVRLVSIEAAPTVVWAEDVALCGDEAPGLFDLGMVTDHRTLQMRALARLAASLRGYLKTGNAPAPRASSKFRPAETYRAFALEQGRTYSVAVLPFLNLTDRGGAGDILALLFIRHLSAFPQFRVIDTGVVRGQLLDARIVMDDGLSLGDADMVASLVDADFVLGGRVLRYAGSTGSATDVRVEFSTVLIERKSRRVVWSSNSHNDAREGVGFFERGVSKTAHAMATQMVRLSAASLAGRPSKVSAPAAR